MIPKGSCKTLCRAAAEAASRSCDHTETCIPLHVSSFGIVTEVKRTMGFKERPCFICKM